MESLPIEISENIFTRLPLESTLQCKRVCKTWRTLLGKSEVGMLFSFERISTSKRKSPREVQLFYGDRICYHPPEDNLEKYDSGNTLTRDSDKKEVSLETLVFGNTIVGSCNGLICFRSKRHRAFVVCNPVTGEHVFLRRYRSSQGGFGYLESTNEYKVVSVYFDRCNQKTYGHVYTLGSRAGWTIITNNIPSVFSFNSSGIFANGAIHWLNINKNIEWEREIVAFDLGDEKFKFVPWPPESYYTASPIELPGLVLLGKNLCTVFHHTGSHQGLDIWSFKKTVNNRRKKSLYPKSVGKEYYYERTWSWNKEFSIACERIGCYHPFAITECNEVLLWLKDTINSQSIYHYDPNTSTLKRFADVYRDSYGSCLQIIPHMNTVVSLKDLGECLDNVGILGHKRKRAKRRS